MVLTNLTFLWAFATTFFETLLLAVSGGFVGVALENALRRWRWMNVSIAFSLRILSWIPFFVFFALPLGGDDTVLAVAVMGTVAVGLHTCSYLHLFRAANPNDWHGFINDVTKCTILRALLFCLFTQLRSQTGWTRVFIQQPGQEVIFSAMIILTVFLFFLDRLLRYSFYDNMRTYTPVLKAELAITKFASFLVLISNAVLCFVVWQLIGENLRPGLAIDPSLSVAGSFVHFVTGGSYSSGANLWNDLLISSLEVWGGLLISSGVSLGLTKVISNESIVSRLIVGVMSITVVTPIILPMLLPFYTINLVGNFSLSTTISVALLTLFPFLRIVVALAGYNKLLVAIAGFKAVLPLAFVGMLVGELFGAVAGLGFRIVSELASANNLAAMAVSLITMSSLLLSILILHWASPSKEVARAMIKQ